MSTVSWRLPTRRSRASAGAVAAAPAPPPPPRRRQRPRSVPRVALPPVARRPVAAAGVAGGRAAPAPAPTRHLTWRAPGSATRANQALDLVRGRPGITIPEMAQAMGIQQNYLYRVLPGLAEEGKVVKSGRGWHLREGAAS